jgi:hypothetical protein
MKMRNAFLVFGTAVIMLSGCSGSSSSGSTLDMNGTWMIYPTSTSTSIAFESFRATLQQSGASVNSTSVTRSPPSGTVDCSSGSLTMSGAVSGAIFNGILRNSHWTATFAMSGTSSSLTGNFTMTIASGPCAGAGTVTGTATMAKV